MARYTNEKCTNRIPQSDPKVIRIEITGSTSRKVFHPPFIIELK